MTAPLDENRLERLAELLDRRAVPFGGLNLEGLDGYLSALLVSPELVMPSVWQAGIFGDKPPRWDSQEEAQEVQDLLMGHWNLVTARVRQSEPVERLFPLILVPDESDGIDLDTEPCGHDWAIGFMRGVDLCKDAWDSWLANEPWIQEAYIDLISLIVGKRLLDDSEYGEGIEAGESIDAVEAAPDASIAELRVGGDDIDPAESSAKLEQADVGAGRPPLRFEDRMEIIYDLPWLLIDLYRHRIEAMTPREPIRRAPTPGRNDPCSCGSGKKYKKCCGQ
jgi:uncharacterized protein